jgi:hypothetical protein
VDIGHKAIAEVLPSFLISGGHSAVLDIRFEKCVHMKNKEEETVLSKPAG